jgi:hypothetical protein
MRDRIFMLAFPALVLAAGNAACAGEIYRCIGANGEVSYTNISCPATSQVQHVASYEPDRYVPPPAPAYDAPARAAEESASDARFAAEQAQEAAYEARLAYEQAQEEQAATEPLAQPALYSPLWVPAYVPSAARFRGGRGHSRHDQVLHLDGPPTPVRSPRWAAGEGNARTPRFRGRH